MIILPDFSKVHWCFLEFRTQCSGRIFHNLFKNFGRGFSYKAPPMVTYFQEGAESPEEEIDEISALEKEAESLSELMITFNEHSKKWQGAVETLARLDVLISFAASAKTSCGSTCRPHFVDNQNTNLGGSVLKIKGLWHPFGTGGQGGVIVPNDLELGTLGEDSRINPRTMLLTGPNMGGKSTLLRATCLAVIMAQVCKSTPKCQKKTIMMLS
jgi:DNA mismatch repair protein MSH6